MSKIQSESNSQLQSCIYRVARVVVYYVKDTIWKQFTTKVDSAEITLSCGFLCQRYNLKAIHNHSLTSTRDGTVVVSYVKDTIWKQFTTGCWWLAWWCALWFPMSKIQSESNSQLYNIKDSIYTCCGFLCQRYNLKAIHNHVVEMQCTVLVVVSYVKDTIWKQFTTSA